MAIRTITFEATLDGISPKAPQNAGIQGEHNATTVVIMLSTQLIIELNKPNTYYRFEFVDCMGQFDTTENFTLSSTATGVNIDIPNGWTSSGGNAELRLVIVRLNVDNNEEMILYSLPCKLKFEGRDTGTGLTPETVEKGLSGLIADAKTATESANSAANAANIAASSADAAASAANAAADAANTAADAANAAADAAVAVGKKTPEGGEIFNSYTGSDANRATAPYSHAEGSWTTASGYASHAEGSWTTASGDFSHAEGGNTTASGVCSHAEGGSTTASGDHSHAGGIGTKATVQAQTSIGKYNAIDADALFIVGNGTTSSSRSNAFTVKLDGSATVQTQGTSNNSVIIKSTLDAAVAEAKSYTDTVAAGKADKSNTYTKTEVDAALSGKVDKVEGKGLSTNDYTNADKAKVENLPENTNAELTLKANAADVESALSDKVDKVAGKGLSTNDYTNEDKAKVDNLPDDTNAALAEKADKSALSETNLRVAEIGKDLSDYKAVLSQLNPNQEAKQTISDYGIVSLPVNAANGHMDVVVGGVTDGGASTISAMRIVSESEDETQRTELYIPDVGELRSLPNGVCDEISGAQRVTKTGIGTIGTERVPQPLNLLSGWGKVGDTSIVSNDTFTTVNSVGVVLNSISAPNEWLLIEMAGTTTAPLTVRNTSSLDGAFTMPKGAFNTKRLVNWKGYVSLYLVINGGGTCTLSKLSIKPVTIESLPVNPSEVITNDGTVIYQLAEPIITPVNVSGTLLSYPKGTVFAEPVLPVAGIYTSGGIPVTNTDFPIESIERIYKINFATGVETPIDVSKVVVAGNGLGFTHPDLADGDIVFFTYYYNAGTQPKISATYFDSRYVLKDTVTGKFYKKVETVQNGQLTTQLVEVS